MNSAKHVKTLTVVTAVNLNPRYLDCVHSYISFWLEFKSSSELEITPHVILVSNEIPVFLSEFSPYISLISPTDLNSAFVAQNIRTLSAGGFKSDYVMTSDVDMFPMNLKVTLSAVRRLEQDNSAFCVVRDVLSPGQYAICYGIASPATWRLIMYGQSEFEPLRELSNLATSAGQTSSYTGEHGGSGWFIDQEHLFNKVNSHFEVPLIKLTDNQTGHRRLDRAHHSKLLTWLLLPLVAFGYFSDYHVHLPQPRARNLITALKYSIRIGRRYKWNS